MHKSIDVSMHAYTIYVSMHVHMYESKNPYVSKYACKEMCMIMYLCAHEYMYICTCLHVCM